MQRFGTCRPRRHCISRRARRGSQPGSAEPRGVMNCACLALEAGGPWPGTAAGADVAEARLSFRYRRSLRWRRLVLPYLLTVTCSCHRLTASAPTHHIEGTLASVSLAAASRGRDGGGLGVDSLRLVLLCLLDYSLRASLSERHAAVFDTLVRPRSSKRVYWAATCRTTAS